MALFTMGINTPVDLGIPTSQALDTELDEWIKKLSLIARVRPGDKLGRDDHTGIYYVDYAGTVQKLRRWWWGQDREKTVKALDADFAEVMRYLDLVLDASRRGTPGRYRAVARRIHSFVNEIMPGLHNLKSTYPSFVKLKCKVDSIITTLIDFKEEMRREEGYDIAQSSARERSRSFH